MKIPITTTDIQVALPLIPKLDTLGSRKISCTSLRPGDWLKFKKLDAFGITGRHPYGTLGNPLFLVLQNSVKLSRIEVWTEYAPSGVYSYIELVGMLYVGQGKRRWWRKFLPRSIRRNICKYSQP